MFQEIRIRGVGVIEDAVLPLGPGLTALTGETGAGKTMVVSGLGLLLGARADAGLVRDGSASAVVEGVVTLPANHPALRRAQEAGADVTDDLVLVRTLTREGRSRAHVGGRSAPVAVLAELGQLLVAVHGQADQWRLRNAEQHRAVLDGFGAEAVRSALARYQETYDGLLIATRERDRLRQLGRDRAREIDVLQAGLKRIEAIDPQPGEDLALRAEDERLAHAEGLRLAAGQAHAALTGEDGYAGDGAASVVGALAAAKSALSPVSGHDQALRELQERVAELGYLAGDLAGDLASYLSEVDVDPARLATVQQRRADLRALTRLYGDTADEVLAWGKAAAATLAELLGADDRAEELERETHRLRGLLAEQARTLTGRRREAAAQFGHRVTEELRHLAMGTAEVTVSVTSRPDPDGLSVDGLSGPGLSGPGLSGPGSPLRFTRHGVDDVEILLVPGPGTLARSVAKGASGGELSRVMLAIEVVGSGSGAGGSSQVPCFVFDEVDAGVGGRAALDVGARLALLARHAQVVVVTHLAQVAAFADRHLVVHKDEQGRITSSSVTEVHDGERLRELSRMMGGDAGSSAGLEHARELLDQASAWRSSGSPGASRRAASS